MRTLNNKIKIDRAVGVVENVSQTEIEMSDSSTKSPWHLCFAPGVLKLKGIAATAGIGLLYGLLFAGLLLSPLPSGKVQAQCEDYTPCYANLEFEDANSRDDCDKILKDVLADIDRRWKKIKAAYDAAKKCDTTYDEELKTADLQHKLHMARAANQAQEIFWECLGFAGLAGGTAGGTSSRLSIRIRGSLVTIGRVGSGILGLVVSIGAFAICQDLRDHTAQDEVDAANNLKKNADELALRKRDRCRRNTNYERVIRRYNAWRGSRPSGGPRRPSNYRLGTYRSLQAQAREDYRKCLEQFPVGDCGTTE